MLTSGGDHELCYALALAGYDIWYDERLQLTHFITKDRLSWDYFLKYVQESSYCFYVLEPYKILLNIRSHTMLQFRLQLMRTYFYLLRKIIRVLIKRAQIAPDTDYYKALTLRYIILKARLVFYSNYSVMHTTFRKVSALKKKLKQVPA
jgi:GT2 family glycosyltransferase